MHLSIYPHPPSPLFFGGGANSTGRSFSTSAKNEKIMDPTPRPRTCSKGCCATQRSPFDHDFGEKSSDSSEMDDFADFSRHLQWRQGEAGPLKRPKSRVSSPRSTSMVVGGGAGEPFKRKGRRTETETKPACMVRTKTSWMTPTKSLRMENGLAIANFIHLKV